MTDVPLHALVLVCTLKPSPAPSSSELLGRQVLEALAEHGVTGEVVRVVDHDVKFGVSTDEGDGDEWPAIRAKMLAADILVIATPIWMGQPSSVVQDGARAARRRALRDRRRGPPAHLRQGRRRSRSSATRTAPTT